MLNSCVAFPDYIASGRNPVRKNQFNSKKPDASIFSGFTSDLQMRRRIFQDRRRPHSNFVGQGVGPF
jgi:hypothetical protein